MALRVVWLVANAYVRPDQVLGLTFTRKAAGELAHRIRLYLGRARHLLGHDAQLIGEPTVATYHSFAARVVREHGMRAGYEPSVRLLTEAACWQLADAAVRQHDSAAMRAFPLEHGERDRRGAGARRRAGRAPARPRTTCAGSPSACRLDRGHVDAAGAQAGPGRARPAAGPARAAAAGRGLRRAQARHGGDGLRRPAARGPRSWPATTPRSARPSATGSGSCCSTSTRTLRRPGGPAALAVRRGPSGDRGRRPVPVHLRLARGQRRHARPVPARVPAHRRRRPPAPAT